MLDSERYPCDICDISAVHLYRHVKFMNKMNMKTKKMERIEIVKMICKKCKNFYSINKKFNHEKVKRDYNSAVQLVDMLNKKADGGRKE